MKLSLETFWLVLWCFTNKVPVDQAVRLTDCSLVTVRRWYARFRLQLPEEAFALLRLAGTVAMDEAYRGGKQRGYAIIGAKEKGRTREGKSPRMILHVLDKSSVDRHDAVQFLTQYIRPNSNLHTDGASIYKGIGNWWPVTHAYERHNRFEFELTAEIEGTWGTFTTFVRRMYHHVTRAHVRAVVREFMARQMFAHWFTSPPQYLATVLTPLERPSKESRKNIKKICMKKILTFPLTMQQKQSIVVPA